ncbi:MAG TPA: restriction endonuclease subunit S [Bacteroidia bacterium]|jgi:type I restriction enzyme S subunit|nr:restriction endonuclease subunit S [Bacteroidia bacterium]
MIKLGDLFHFVNGRGFKKSEWENVGLPIIRIQNLNNLNAGFNYFKGSFDKKIEIKKGDLLFSWSGTIGTSFGPHIWNGETALLNQHIFKLEFKEEIDRDYAFHSLKHITAEIEKHVNGAVGLVHITKEKLKQFEIPLPPLSEQKQIVAILDETFFAINKAKTNAEQNLKNVKELFESYLQEFFEKKGEACQERKLEEICHIIGGGTPSKSNKKYYGGDIYWATVRDMKSEIVTNTEHKITKDAVTNSATNIIPKGNVIIATRVGLGKVCIVANDTAINQDLKGVIPIDPKELSVDFLFRWFKSISSKIIEEGTGATVQGVKLPFIKSLTIWLPPLDTQQAITKKIDILSLEIEKLEAIYQKKINSLEELKKSILQKAFNGELKTHSNATA